MLLQRARGNAENVFDEVKNQWGFQCFCSRRGVAAEVAARLVWLTYSRLFLSFVGFKSIDPLCSCISVSENAHLDATENCRFTSDATTLTVETDSLLACMLFPVRLGVGSRLGARSGGRFERRQPDGLHCG